jgi:prepilin-type N-terminal cleavage/methylation domain-containing protein
MRRPTAPAGRREHRARGDDGMTLVELMVAMTLLIVLLTIVTVSLSAYLTTSTNVLSSYRSTDELLPTSVIIQRLIRSEVEPAPTPAASVAVPHPTPTPGFALTSTSPYSSPPIATQPGVSPAQPTVAWSPSTVPMSVNSMSFYANVGDPNGPAEIVMAETANPYPCSGCTFPTSTFTVTQISAAAGTCPGVSSGSACSYPSTSPTKQILSIPDVVNGTTAAPIFTYTLFHAGIPETVATANIAALNSTGCTGSANLTTSCPADDLQSVAVDLRIHIRGTPTAENEFTVFRLSSSSYLYSPLVG